MRFRRTSQLFLAVGIISAVGVGRAGSIDFDTNLPSGLTPNANGYCQGCAVSTAAQITNQFANLGAIFTTKGGAAYAALVPLGSGHATSGTNGIGAVSSANNLDYTLDIDIFLVVPGTLTPAVTNSISIRGDLIPSYGNVIYSAYDLNGNLVASGTQQDTGGNTFALAAPGIREFRLHSVNGDVAYDDLVFATPALAVTTATPEPSSFGLCGAALSCLFYLGKKARSLA